MAERNRNNISISATAEVVAEIDDLVEVSPVETSRSRVALAALREGLPAVAARIRAASKPTVAT